MYNLKQRFIIGILLTILLLSGCGTVEKDALNNIEQDRQAQATVITEDTMTGYVTGIDTKTREVSLNISKWVNRGKTLVEDIMHSKKIIYNPEFRK